MSQVRVALPVIMASQLSRIHWANSFLKGLCLLNDWPLQVDRRHGQGHCTAFWENGESQVVYQAGQLALLHLLKASREAVWKAMTGIGEHARHKGPPSLLL